MKDVGVEQKPDAYVVFISHASADAGKAQAICQQLELAGLPCWIAPRDVRPGQDYPEEIIRGIEASKCLILVLSQNSNNSRAVRDEVERAWSKGKRLYPIRIDDVLPSRSLELLVSTSHWTDARQEALQKPIQRLVAQLSQNDDVVPNLPPEFRRKIRLRRYLRYGAYAGAIVGIAAVVALVLRTVPQEAPREVFTKPPVISFFGSLVGPRFPLEATVLIQSGYDQEGMVDIFRKPVSFTLSDVGQDTPSPIYRSPPGKFAGAFEKAPTFSVPLPAVPLRVVACLTYTAPKTEQASVLLAAYTFTPPGGPTGTFSADKSGPDEVRAPAAPADCGALTREYAARHLRSLPALDTRQAARARSYPVTIRCGHDNNPAILACTAVVAQANSSAREVRAGFHASDLRFVVPLDKTAGPQGTPFALPASAGTVFASVSYDDGSPTDPAAVDVSDAMHLVLGPPPSEVVPSEGKGPSLYIGENPHNTNPAWGLAVAAPPSTVAASWSRDNQSFTGLARRGSLFVATISPQDLGIARPVPPLSEQPRTIWINLHGADGKDTVAQYSVDFWRMLRTNLRAVLPPDTMVRCTENESWTRITLGSVKVACAFTGYSGLLLSDVHMGTHPDELRPADPSTVGGTIDSFLEAQGVGAPDRQRVLSSIRQTSYPSAQTLTDWSRCGNTPALGNDCAGPSFVATEAATTIYARFRYWDGQETGLLKLPVR